ncbi:MAG: tetratricopeptide repeat protein [Alphaproteobacteria bacterium]|nr:MAG: tetratricopeptide repeat protein [Alphaproteobacteria bacterium]
MAENPEAVGALFREGKLMPAIEAANAAVRKNPTDLGSRILLAELLLFTGNVERADVILDAAAQADPGSLIAVAEFRQLLRAEIARRQYSREGRVPEFLGDPTEALRATLAAGVALRAGDIEEAARRAAEAEEARPRVSGAATQQDSTMSFDDFRDVDDLQAGFFEVLTTTGKYFWIPTERVASVEFEAPRRPRDLVWRRATMVVTDGPDGVVYIPALYDSGNKDLGDELRLGRATEWVDEETGPVRGIGRRVFLIGDEDRSIMELAALRFGS